MRKKKKIYMPQHRMTALFHEQCGVQLTKSPFANVPVAKESQKPIQTEQKRHLDDFFWVNVLDDAFS